MTGRRPPPYRDAPASSHSKSKTGVLLVNLGTPEAPTNSAVRRYLRQFLSDPRVVEKPRLRWWLILNLFILTTAPAGSARRYRRVWTEEGSPLLVISRQLRDAVADRLAAESDEPPEVLLGMRYGRPSIAEALEPLRRAGCRRLLCLPLYPQYSGATTGSVFDAVAAELATWRVVPELRTIHSYHDAAGYIGALVASVRSVWQAEGPAERLLISFHGLPERSAVGGDPYVEHCRETAALVREGLALTEHRSAIAFQSRFGRDAWVEPATEDVVRELAESGVAELDVICPGFAVDCVETLDEVGHELQTVFGEAGGQRLRLIPCLNASRLHGEFLAGVIRQSIFHWEDIAK